VYGAIYALGTDSPNSNPLNIGMFTYEYQHPHGAVMPYTGISQYTGQDTLYSYIDLHRHALNAPGSANLPLWTRWPNSGQPTHGYPGGNNVYGDYLSSNTSPLYGTSDWPWYNPVWPEKDGGSVPQNPATDITWERGTFHFSGVGSQRARGEFHISGNSSNQLGIWDIPNRFGPVHNVNGYGSTGYNTEFTGDRRYNVYHFVSKYLFPIEFNLKTKVINSDNSVMPENNIQSSLSISELQTASFDDKVAIAFLDYGDMNLHLRYSNNSGQSFDSLQFNNVENLHDIKYFNNKLKILTKTYDSFYLYTFDPDSLNLNPQPILINQFDSESGVIDAQLITASNDLLMYYQFEKYDEAGTLNTFTKIVSINNPANPVDLENLEPYKYSFAIGSGDSLYIVSNKVSQYYDMVDLYNLYFAKAFLNGVTPTDPDSPNPIPSFKLNCYPNPFNPSLNIDFYLTQETEINLSLYNIKGQKVKNIFNGSLSNGKHHFSCTGVSEENKTLASGIYFVKATGHGINRIQKVILLK
jgi:hypothetical protein